MSRFSMSSTLPGLNGRCGRSSRSASRGYSEALAKWLDGHVIDQELGAGDDQFVSRFEAGGDGIGIAYGFPEGDGDLTSGEVSVGLLLRHEDEALSALPGDREHGNDRHGGGLPDDAGLDQLRSAQDLNRAVHGGLEQDA